MERQVIRFSRLQADVVEWWNKCLRENSFCTVPNPYDIDFDSLYDELVQRTSLLNKNNTDPDE